jgi:hypothetical protein
MRGINLPIIQPTNKYKHKSKLIIMDVSVVRILSFLQNCLFSFLFVLLVIVGLLILLYFSPSLFPLRPHSCFFFLFFFFIPSNFDYSSRDYFFIYFVFPPTKYVIVTILPSFLSIHSSLFLSSFPE